MWNRLRLITYNVRVPSMAQPRLLNIDIPIEEERKGDYDPKHFYPVKLGQIFAEAYQVVTKLGFGGSSTVWLAKDVRRYVSVITKLTPFY